MIKKLLNQSLSNKQAERKNEVYNRLIRHEARIGGSLFGEMPASGRREFFCLDERTWVWYEEWNDQATGQRRAHTTRYETRPDCILKVRDNGQYEPVNREEAAHLLEAAKSYQQAVRQRLYKTAA